jgi:preprotein translocase subunit YajC
MLYAFLVFAQEQGDKTPGPPIWATFMPLIIIFALFYFLLILPERRREKRQREELNNKLKKNDKVVTNAGIIAVVVNVRDNEVDLRIDKETNARLTVIKTSIARILTDEDQKEAAGRGGSAETAVKAGTPQGGK